MAKLSNWQEALCFKRKKTDHRSVFGHWLTAQSERFFHTILWKQTSRKTWYEQWRDKNTTKVVLEKNGERLKSKPC